MFNTILKFNARNNPTLRHKRSQHLGNKKDMKTFEILLTRSYKIEIDAKNESEALFNAEFFIGGEKDISNDRERAEHGFRINEIEMTVNEAFECNEKLNG